MMDRGTVRNMQSFIPKKIRKIVHLVGFIIGNHIFLKLSVSVFRGQNYSNQNVVAAYDSAKR